MNFSLMLCLHFLVPLSDVFYSGLYPVAVVYEVRPIGSLPSLRDPIVNWLRSPLWWFWLWSSDDSRARPKYLSWWVYLISRSYSASHEFSSRLRFLVAFLNLSKCFSMFIAFSLPCLMSVGSSCFSVFRHRWLHVLRFSTLGGLSGVFGDSTRRSSCSFSSSA